MLRYTDPRKIYNGGFAMNSDDSDNDMEDKRR